MSIAIVSKLFIVRESIASCLRADFKKYDIKLSKQLSDLNVQDVELLFVDADNGHIDNIIDFKNKYNKIKVIVFDLSKNKEVYIKSMQHNIEGYLADLEEKNDILVAFSQILKGKNFYDPLMVQDSILQMYNEQQSSKSRLTKREQEVLSEVEKGHTNKEISSKLYISEHTVKKHITNILNKLGANNRRDLILMYEK